MHLDKTNIMYFGPHHSMLTGVDNLNSKYGGVHSFCISHRAYHMIGLGRIPAGMRPTFLQLCIHDQDELNDRMAMKVAEKLGRNVMQALQQELHLVNPLVRRFKAINPADLQPEMDIEIRADISEICTVLYGKHVSGALAYLLTHVINCRWA